MKNKIILIFSFLLLCTLTSCSSYKQFKYITEEFEIPSKIFNADYAQTWQAVLQVMKKYELATNDQESGIIKTRWIENTLEMNFADSFGRKDSVKGAKFKVILNVVKGYQRGREVCKVTVYKRQLAEQGFLQGWKEIPSDGIFEKTVLYRLARVISIDKKLKKIEKQRELEQEVQLEADF